MNTQIRRVTSLVLVMFLALFGSTTTAQYIKANQLRSDPRNVRAFYDSFNRDRGPIIVDGKNIASSVGVDDDFSYQRKYAAGPKYAAATGFFSVVFGLTGIEAAEDAVLQGTADSLFLSRVQDLFTGKQPQGGAVELTLERAAQDAAWKGLGSQRGAVVALDPTTGEILALVSRPSYDPADLAGHDTSKVNEAYQGLLADQDNPLWNRAIAGNLYTPGSTFKLITAAAALETGKYTADSVLDSPDRLPLPGSDVDLPNMGDSKCSATGKMSMAQALAVSCNTAFASLGLKLGAKALQDQASAFGFGQKLSIPLAVTPSKIGQDLDQPQTAMTAIGQFDDRVTPLQMAMVVSAIAHGGTMMKPHLVRATRDADLKVLHQTKPEVLSTPISRSTATALRKMMIGVVTNGSGGTAALGGMDVGGKTGTAEKAEGQAPDNWFVSFADDGERQIAVAVVVEDGGKAGMSGTGGAVAGPIARAVMAAVMNP